MANLAATSHDIAAAEDALADALEAALVTWPQTGVPGNPTGWVFTVARNRLRDLYRSSAHRTRAGDASWWAEEREAVDTADMAPEPDEIGDKRLELMFVCAHPAIDPAVRAPLMLQTVLGFTADQIASAFAAPASTMAARLVRAKHRITAAGIPFVVPTRNQMASRLPAVLEAIYGTYAIDWQFVAGSTPRVSLADEALYLATTLAHLLPREPEPLGLAALLAFSLSRSRAREIDGSLVPIDEQDTALWDSALVADAERLLARAHALGSPVGRFQLEAAIQSVHANRARSGFTDWQALRKLHLALVTIAPSLGAHVSLAAVIGQQDPREGLRMLDTLDGVTQRFQPAWATRASLLAAAGEPSAHDAYRRAISLTTDTPSRRFLEDAMARLDN